MTVTARTITVLDGFDQRHEAVRGDDVPARIKSSGVSSGRTILAQEPQGRYAATLLRPDGSSFLALGWRRPPTIRDGSSPRRQRHVDGIVMPIAGDQQLLQIGELVDADDHDLERAVGGHLPGSQLRPRIS